MFKRVLTFNSWSLFNLLAFKTLYSIEIALFHSDLKKKINNQEIKLNLIEVKQHHNNALSLSPSIQ